MPASSPLCLWLAPVEGRSSRTVVHRLVVPVPHLQHVADDGLAAGPAPRARRGQSRSGLPAVGVSITGLPGAPATVAELIVNRRAERDRGRNSCMQLPILRGQQGRKERRWGGEGAASVCIQNFSVSVESGLL